MDSTVGQGVVTSIVVPPQPCYRFHVNGGTLWGPVTVCVLGVGGCAISTEMQLHCNFIMVISTLFSDCAQFRAI